MIKALLLIGLYAQVYNCTTIDFGDGISETFCPGQKGEEDVIIRNLDLTEESSDDKKEEYESDERRFWDTPWETKEE